MRSLFTSILLVGLFLGSATAHAQEASSAADIRRAAAAFDRGREAFRNESYVEAAEHFEAADAHAPSASSHRLAMLSRMQAGQLSRAATLAALALDKYPDEATLVDEAKSIVNEAASQLGRVEVTCDEPCDLLLDGKLVHGEREQSRQLYVEPGDHRLQASWSDERVVTEQLSVPEGGKTGVDFYAPLAQDTAEPAGPAADESDEPAPAAQEQEADEGGWSPVVFWTGAGATALGIGVSSWLGVKALNEPGRETVETACVGQGFDCPEWQQGKANERNANIAVGVTAAAGVFTIITGIWLTDWGGGADDDASEPVDDVWSYRRGDFSLRPLFAVGDGATLGAVGTF